jgi:hypothetical protein
MSSWSDEQKCKPIQKCFRRGGGTFLWGIIRPKRWRMLLRFAAVLFIGLITFAPQAVTQKAPTGSCQLSRDDYAVYDALVKRFSKTDALDETWRGKEILIVDRTGIFADTNGWSGWGSTESKVAPQTETVANLRVHAHEECIVEQSWGDRESYRLLSHTEIEKTFKRRLTGAKEFQDAWADFHKRYPQSGGFLTFSRPGYNAAKNEALVYVAYACGGRCGVGHLYLLVRHDGMWQVENRLITWIS